MNARRFLFTRGGFTLVEVLVACAASVVVGSIIYGILNTGLILFAKNSAINAAHQQARVTVLKIENDLHSAVSLPQLIDASRVPVGGVGPAAGISFQIFAGGPFKLQASAAAGQPSITVKVGSYQPAPGQRLIIPSHHIELDVAAVGALTGAERKITLTSNLPRQVATSLDNGGIPSPVEVTGFFTDRVSYVVNGSELRFYARAGIAQYTVMANDITSAIPFSTPLTPEGAPYYRFVTAINLSTADRSVSNRGFKAANMFLSAMVPARARLCTFQ